MFSSMSVFDINYKICPEKSLIRFIFLYIVSVSMHSINNVRIKLIFLSRFREFL